MKKTLLALAVLGLGYMAACFGTGHLVQRQMDAELARLKGMIPQLKVTEDRHTRGVFGSIRMTTFDIGALLDKQHCATPDDGGDVAGEEADKPPPALGTPAAEPLRVSLKQTITHGPLPGFGLPAAASVRYQLLLNGQPVGDKLGVKIEGEIPRLVTRYGFTGNSSARLSGDAGKLVFVPKDGGGELTVAWPSLRMDGRSKADLSEMDYQGQLPELTVSFATPKGERGALKMKGLAVEAEHQYPIAGQLFVYTGTDQLRLASLTLELDGKTAFAAEGIEGRSQGTLDAGLLGSTTQIAVNTVKAGGETVGPMHYDFSLARLDAAAYGQLMGSLFSDDLGRCPSAEDSAAMMQKITAQLPALLKSGLQFRIDRISIGYEGEAALITGKLDLPAATAEQLENPMALFVLANANLMLTLPDKLIQNLAVKSMGSKMAAEMALAGGMENPPPPTPGQLAEAEAMAKTMVAQQMEQALAKNWIVRGKDGVTSRIEYRNGAALLNGQPLDLDGLRDGGAAAGE